MPICKIFKRYILSLFFIDLYLNQKGTIELNALNPISSQLMNLIDGRLDFLDSFIKLLSFDAFYNVKMADKSPIVVDSNGYNNQSKQDDQYSSKNLIVIYKWEQVSTIAIQTTSNSRC